MKQRYFCILVGMMVFFAVQTGGVSAHTLSPSSKQVHTMTPAFTCFSDGCDGIAPAGASCGGTAVRVYDAPMVAHNGTTVGHLYWYYFPYVGCAVPSWGTFHLSSGIKSGTVYETRSHTTDDNIINESATYTNPSIGVYHDTAMLGCDFDSPGPTDYYNAAIDWEDSQGFFLHTQTPTDTTGLNC